MEIAGMQILMKDYSSSGDVVIEGSMGENAYVVEKIEQHLGIKAHVLDRWSAAVGCAEIARDIHNGAKEILGLKVNFSI